MDKAKVATLAVVVSVLALCVSLGMPVATYFWLQNDKRIGDSKASSILADSYVQIATDLSETYFVHVRNRGSLPVEKVRVVTEIESQPLLDDDRTRVEVYPPVQNTVTVVRNSLTVTLDDPVAGGADINIRLITIRPIPAPADGTLTSDLVSPPIWLSSQYSGPTLLGWLRIDKQPLTFPPAKQ